MTNLRPRQLAVGTTIGPIDRSAFTHGVGGCSRDGRVAELRWPRPHHWPRWGRRDSAPAAAAAGTVGTTTGGSPAVTGRPMGQPTAAGPATRGSTAVRATGRRWAGASRRTRPAVQPSACRRQARPAQPHQIVRGDRRRRHRGGARRGRCAGLHPQQGSAGAATPKEAARAYLAALERGDAKSALALTSFSPPDTTFVTDEVLRKQQEKFPIRNIRVLGEDTNLVHVVFDIGDDVYDGYMTVTPPADGKGWLVAEGVMSVEFHVDKMSPELAKWITLFDQPIPSSRIAYIFPGYIGLGSANPNLIARSWNERPSGLMFILGEESVRPQIEVSDEGKKFIEDQLRAAVEECAKSPNSSPNCPNGRAYTPYFVEGTAKWRLEKLTDVRVYPINTETGAVDVSARAEFTVTGRGINRYAPDSDEVSIFMTATVDFTQDPPKFELKG